MRDYRQTQLEVPTLSSGRLIRVRRVLNHYQLNILGFIGTAVNEKEQSCIASRRAVVHMLIVCVVAFYVCYSFPATVHLIE